MIDRLSALSHPQRLRLFRLLMRRYPDSVPAGEIAQGLRAGPSTVSAWLSCLSRAGLITQERFGTSLHYRPSPDALREVISYLWADCGRGRADLMHPLLHMNQGRSAMTDTPFRVLFICTGNSARSIFAETILAELGGDRFEAHSAGTKPASELNPMAIRMLEDKGHATDALTSKNVSVYQVADAPDFDFVFTVCDAAANEDCPTWPGQPMTAHWSTPDPVKATGTDAERMLAFQRAYGMLRNRIAVFTALPFDELDRLSLQRALDEISDLEDAE